MNTISEEEIGRRIAELRKQKGYSQTELAQILNISRPSLTQIELGNRKLSVVEFKKVADFLSVSMDAFFAKDYILSDSKIDFVVNEDAPKYRADSPTFNISKFQNVLLYILEKCAGKPNIGETVLNKLLYFSDFNYYEIYEEHLTGAQYRKLPYGPVPEKLDAVIQEMIENKSLKRFKSSYYELPQTRYIPLAKPDLTQLKASEKQVIDSILELYSDWSATSISEYSHNDMPWKATKDGDVIDYELTFYRELPYSVRNYEEETQLV